MIEESNLDYFSHCLIPNSPWESISIDFIFGLPKSLHGNTFISQIFKYHGLPTSIVSDRDPRMTTNFWKGLFDNLGMRLDFSSAYHPQMDGQSKIANLMILDLLKNYVNVVDQRSQWKSTYLS